MTRQPRTRRKPSREHRLVLVAGAISGAVGLLTTMLVHTTGAILPAALIAGGTSVGATMTLAMEVLRYLRGL